MSTLPLEDTGRSPSMSSVHDAPGSVQESPCVTVAEAGPFRVSAGAASTGSEPVELVGASGSTPPTTIRERSSRVAGGAGTTSTSMLAVSAWPALSVQVYVMV